MPPRKQPPALRALRGRGHNRDSGGRLIEPPPPFKRTAPEPPEWLDEEARAEWDRVVPDLDHLALLKASTRASLAAYCSTWALYRQAIETVQREGLVSDHKNGVRAHPALRIATAAARDLRAWCGEFGLTPCAEGRIDLPPRDDDELDPLGLLN